MNAMDYQFSSTVIFQKKGEDRWSAIDMVDENYRIYEFSGVAADICRMLQEKQDRAQMIEWLANNYEVERGELEKDVEEFFAELVKLKILLKE